MLVDWRKHGGLLVALALAGVLHALLILGVGFDFPKPKLEGKSMEVLLVVSPSKKVPEKADFLAPVNQQGSGESKKKALPKPALQLPRKSFEAQPVKPEVEEKPAPVVKTSPKPVALQEPQPKPAPVLKQAKSEKKVVEAVGEAKQAETSAHPRLTAEMLSQQITEVTGEFNKSLQNQAKQHRMVYINSVNAHRYNAASYEMAWQEKVERIGNLNYPDEARRQKLSGSLLLAVAINSDGSLYSVKVRQSSGEPVLDEAAQGIVQLAAPFSPFPEELKQEADVLVITRTWHFSADNRVETGR